MWAVLSRVQRHQNNSVFTFVSTNVETCVMNCTCKTGSSGNCKHVVATLLFINKLRCLDDLDEISSTDISCSWMKAVKRSYSPTPLHSYGSIAVEECEELYKPSPGAVDLSQLWPNLALAKHKKGRRLPPNDEFLKTACQLVNKNSLWLNDLEITARKCCTSFLAKWEKLDTYKICRDTLLSRVLWQEERKTRITASQCYSLYTYSTGKGLSDDADWKKKAGSLISPKQLFLTSLEYGIANEAKARQAFERAHPDFSVISAGLIVPNNCPWFGCTPDAIIFKDGQPLMVLEIKCPVLGKKYALNSVLPQSKYIEKQGLKRTTSKRIMNTTAKCKETTILSKECVML